jgi:hypothetical protein
MKLNIAIVFAATLLMTGIAEAQVRTLTKTGPNGKTLVVKMDGKYSTCFRDGLRLGYSADTVKRYCDSRPNLTR